MRGKGRPPFNGCPSSALLFDDSAQKPCFGATPRWLARRLSTFSLRNQGRLLNCQGTGCGDDGTRSKRGICGVQLMPVDAPGRCRKDLCARTVTLATTPQRRLKSVRSLMQRSAVPRTGSRSRGHCGAERGNSNQNGSSHRQSGTPASMRRSEPVAGRRHDKPRGISAMVPEDNSF
jgi:hypothetical protein